MYCDRLIIIAEKKEVYSRFPTPLVNRLEKHIVDTSTVLNERQKEILAKLINWIKNFNSVANYKYVTMIKILAYNYNACACTYFYRFQPADSFIGYQDDTPSAVVFTASKNSPAQELDPASEEWKKEV